MGEVSLEVQHCNVNKDEEKQIEATKQTYASS